MAPSFRLKFLEHVNIDLWDLLYRRIPNNLCRQVPLQKMEFLSPPACVWAVLTDWLSKSRIWKRVVVTLQWRNMANAALGESDHGSTLWVMLIPRSPDKTWGEWHFTFVIFPPKIYTPNLTMRWILDKPKLRYTPQNACLMLLKTVSHQKE